MFWRNKQLYRNIRRLKWCWQVSMLVNSIHCIANCIRLVMMSLLEKILRRMVLSVSDDRVHFVGTHTRVTKRLCTASSQILPSFRSLQIWPRLNNSKWNVTYLPINLYGRESSINGVFSNGVKPADSLLFGRLVWISPAMNHVPANQIKLISLATWPRGRAALSSPGNSVFAHDSVTHLFIGKCPKIMNSSFRRIKLNIPIEIREPAPF
jgi:hypothetical protein